MFYGGQNLKFFSRFARIFFFALRARDLAPPKPKSCGRPCLRRTQCPVIPTLLLLAKCQVGKNNVNGIEGKYYQPKKRCQLSKQ